MIHALIASLLISPVFADPASYVRTVERTDGVAVSQTKTQKLVAPGKPDIYLVGVAHIGSKSYYSEIQAVLNAQDVVLFEGVRSKGKPSVPVKPDPKAPKQMYQVISDALGLDFQLFDIDYNHPNWINSDLSMEELDRLNKKAGKGKATDFDMVEKLLDPNSPQTQQAAAFFGSAPASIKEALKIFLVEKISTIETMLNASLDPATVSILLTERNKSIAKAFEKAISVANPPKSVAIFYGAAHLPEVQKALAARYGYKPADQQWFTFAKADRRKLDATGRQFLDTLGNLAKMKG